MLVVAAVLVALAAATVVVGMQGKGPLGTLLCATSMTSYDRIPSPAPLLEGTVTLRAGEKVSVGGYGDPLPRDTAPELIGDASAIELSSTVAPTEEHCDRVVSGYRFQVLTAVRPVTLELLSQRPARVRVTAA
ncbi:hypothetical protein [Luedemannella helvata]